jgi:SOS response regulatory protein OraA/RecX
MEEESSSKIMHRAGLLLARRPYSRGELREKLSMLGDHQEIESTLDRLQELNLLNDVNYSYNLASYWMKHEGWGPIKVRFHLLRRQLSEAVADATLDRIGQELSDADLLVAYLERRARNHPLPGDRRGIRKLVASLRQRGFPDEAVYGVLRQRIPTVAWKKFDTGE